MTQTPDARLALLDEQIERKRRQLNSNRGSQKLFNERREVLRGLLAQRAEIVAEAAAK